MGERAYYTLVDLSESLKSVIGRNYSGVYRIKAEITKLNFYKKTGHCYPDLIEKQGGTVKAQMRGTIWSAPFREMNARFIKVTGEPLSEGMTILFKARVNYHEVYGLSLNIIDVEPSFTLGEMAKEKQQTIEQLKKEGIFDHNRKLPPVQIPKRIAVISVESSKGYSDFINILDNNNRGYAFRHRLFTALLQGEKAVYSIVDALEDIRKKKDEFDVVAIIRGGGGDVGLSCYDHFALAREVAGFPLPVITGIGHSTNETVTELVAFNNSITPTQVAYRLIEYFDKAAEKAERLHSGIRQYAAEKITRENTRLLENIKYFSSFTQNLLTGQNGALDSLSGRLLSRAPLFIRHERSRLIEVSSGLKYKPLQSLSEHNAVLNRAASLLKLKAKQRLHDEGRLLAGSEKELKLLNPQNVLKRGYSITTHNGKMISEAEGLSKGDLIETRFAKGKAQSKVEHTETDE